MKGVKKMLNIEKTLEDGTLLIELEGRLDTTTAPDLESAIMDSIDGITDLTLNFKGLEYISSAGLRVLLSAQKKMNAKGSMKVTNVSPEIDEIFEVTGFSDILTIE